jgi:hypothetical protein
MTSLLGGHDPLGDRAHDAAVAAQINVCRSNRPDATWRDDAVALRHGERCVYCARRMRLDGQPQECHGDQSDDR